MPECTCPSERYSLGSPVFPANLVVKWLPIQLPKINLSFIHYTVSLTVLHAEQLGLLQRQLRVIIFLLLFYYNCPNFPPLLSPAPPTPPPPPQSIPIPLSMSMSHLYLFFNLALPLLSSVILLSLTPTLGIILNLL